jgi:hypothetical protein
MVKAIFEAEVHAKRVESLANGATGAMLAGRAAIHAIGAAYAEVAEIKPRHGVKQVDRYLSNQGIDVEALTPCWIAFVLGSRGEALIALDWTEFDADDHATLCAYLVTTHGRATPLCWQTVRKSSLGNGLRTETEIALVERLARAIAPEVAITLLADRGFGNQRLYQTLDLLGWHYVIRFRGNITVAHAGQSKPARAWLPANGRATKLAGAQVTDARTLVGAVVVVHAKRMKEPWCLATNLGQQSAAVIVKGYSVCRLIASAGFGNRKFCQADFLLLPGPVGRAELHTLDDCGVSSSQLSLDCELPPERRCWQPQQLTKESKHGLLRCPSPSTPHHDRARASEGTQGHGRARPRFPRPCPLRLGPGDRAARARGPRARRRRHHRGRRHDQAPHHPAGLQGCTKRPAPQEIFLPDSIHYKLGRLLAWKKRRSESLAPDAPLFVSREGNRLSTRMARTAFRRWQQRAGLDRIHSFHALRHTACTNLYRKTRDIRLVQRFARHVNIHTTTIYAQSTEEDLMRAVRELPC